MQNFWLAVASAEHVRIGRTQGFMQVCHGKAAPLKRIHPGDGVVYYSPTEIMGTQTPYKKFTAIGIVQPGEPYPVEMAPGFVPFRKNVVWAQGSEVSIQPLLLRLSFTANNRNWGYQLRFGLIRIPGDDFGLIQKQMNADLDPIRVDYETTELCLFI